MSTLVDLLDEIQDRIPPRLYGRVIPITNRAVRTLAKRLMLFESDLVKGDLDVDMWDSVDYTAATIAFTVGNKDIVGTITDSASQFVAEGFVAGMNIYTDSVINPGPFKVTAVAVGTLTLQASDTVTAAAAGSSITITSDDSYGELPSDFWGLDGKPNIDGQYWLLEPVPDRITKLQHTTPGQPVYYEIKGQKLCVYPPTSTDITLKGSYWQKPTAITSLNDTLPFSELFDDAIQEILIKTLAIGSLTTAEFEAFLFKAVDLMIPMREGKAPTKTPGGIDYDNLM